MAAVGAAAVAVVTDLTTASVERWWNQHSIVAALVGSSLILAVTVLIVDEVTARRGIVERARVAAVQSVIVYGQALRTEEVLAASGVGAEGEDAAAEVRTLAFMLLTAAPALFDDPAARHFMERAERFSASLLRVGLSRADHAVSDDDRKRLQEAKEELRVAIQPMLARLGPEATILEWRTPDPPPSAGNHS